MEKQRGVRGRGRCVPTTGHTARWYRKRSIRNGIKRRQLRRRRGGKQ